jgi:hypothetical protein
MADDTCENCRFWRKNVGDYDGACHRNAPSPMPNIVAELAYKLAYPDKARLCPDSIEPDCASAMAFWPDVDPDDWCGEYEAKPDALVTDH